MPEQCTNKAWRKILEGNKLHNYINPKNFFEQTNEMSLSQANGNCIVSTKTKNQNRENA